jgi:5-methylcytosine-specific restriction endonuclease McrA
MSDEKSDKELTIEEIFSAVPTDEEPDRSKIKWRKRKWKIPTRPGMIIDGKPFYHRPPPKIYYEILRNAGRNVCVCERCGSDYRITIHHKDGNPFNNQLENLEVLCWNCHSLVHNPEEEGIHHELEGTKADIDTLDDPDVRRFLGIVDEEEDL